MLKIPNKNGEDTKHPRLHVGYYKDKLVRQSLYYSHYCETYSFIYSINVKLTRSDFDDSKKDKKPKRKEGVKVRLLQ